MSQTAAERATAGASARQDGRAAIRWWLYGVCVLIFVMVVVGGATRLTDSGLSITEWQPILGILPPLSDADWQDAFAKYRQIPEYGIVNKGMTLEGFKTIFWWEWTHRFLGRMIGFAFLLPFLFFWFAGRIEKGLMPKLVAMFALGGLQGVLGWHMVASGLVDRIDVSQYRLAAHLAAAVFIFGYVLWVALSLREAPATTSRPGRGQTVSAAGLAALIFLQIGLGAFVAGLDAGMGYNSWPLIDGAIVPDGLWVMSPWYLNLFENALTVQFDHRMAAYAVVLWALAHAAFAVRRNGEGAVVAGAVLVAAAALAQAGLGVWTLLARVPISLGLLHQAGAMILFALALWHLQRLVATARPAAA